MNDRILGIFALILAAFITWGGWDIEAPFSYEPVGPRAFPMLLAGIIALCGLWLVFKGGHHTEETASGAKGRIALMVAYAALYAVLFQWLGFVLSTTLITVLVGRLFGGGWGKCAVGGIVMGILFFLLFDKVLDVVLPTGVLGELI